MNKNTFVIPLGAYAKIYHDLAKKMGCSASDVKLFLNSYYGNCTSEQLNIAYNYFMNYLKNKYK